MPEELKTKGSLVSALRALQHLSILHLLWLGFLLITTNVLIDVLAVRWLHGTGQFWLL